MNFYSQVGQDKFLLEYFFRGKRDGIFVDVGAYDGETFSNTLFFERHMGWRGLCIEPLPSAFAKLKVRRKATLEQCCVADFEGEADFVEVEDTVDINQKMLSGLASHFDAAHAARMEHFRARKTQYKVSVHRLASLLEKHGLYHVDYCSMDTEGSEMAILADLDLDRFRIDVLTVEHNYGSDAITGLMAKKGYELVGMLQHDYVFKRRDVKALPRTTVFCAVWHGDPKRHALLRGHQANLASQTVPLDVIYVFDGGDPPPDWLEARSITVHEKLTIYQAWNVALSLVGTPLMMNLNLDDRLAPDAVAVLQNALMQTGAIAAAGDWKICYSQEETDAVRPCYAANTVPFVQDWPPKTGTVTRLGSGMGERGTYGPATIWRADAHMSVPRYPWRLSDGTLLKSAADAVWWSVLGNNPRYKMLRLPQIIGNYYSHPSEQAEFRVEYDEVALIQQTGVSLI